MRATLGPIGLSQRGFLSIQAVLCKETLVALDLVPELLGSGRDDRSLKGDQEWVWVGKRVVSGVVQMKDKLQPHMST